MREVEGATVPEHRAAPTFALAKRVVRRPALLASILLSIADCRPALDVPPAILSPSGDIVIADGQTVVFFAREPARLVGFPDGVQYSCNSPANVAYTDLDGKQPWVACPKISWISIHVPDKLSDKAQATAAYVCAGNCRDYEPVHYRRVRFVGASQ